MKFLRISLAVVAGSLVLVVVGGAVVAVGAGAFWLYVYGDDPWPSYAEPVLPTAAAVAGLAAGFAIAAGVWMLTKATRFDRDGG